MNRDIVFLKMLEAAKKPIWDDADYCIDNRNVIWKIVRDGGMVERTNENSHIESAGIFWLEKTFGPVFYINSQNLRKVLLELEGVVT